jgi:formylglycine-generating enzyme required for sulfatase activity
MAWEHAMRSIVWMIVTSAGLLCAQPSCAPLQLGEIRDLLALRPPETTRILGLLDVCGARVTLTPEDERDLRDRGATEAIIRALRQPVAKEDAARDLEFWRSIADTNDPTLYREYLRLFPAGTFRAIAEQRANRTAPGTSSAAPTDRPAAPATTIDLAGLRFAFITIAPGEFRMGDPKRKDAPPHTVRITKPFAIGRCEVSQAQWEAVMGYNHSRLLQKKPEGKLRHPVTNVSWNEVQTFLDKLNAADPGAHYRLPTEAEWEYVATSANTNHARDYTTDEPGVAECAKQAPNAWGVYDMPGNAAEWVNDYHDPNYYLNSPTSDPPGPPTGTDHVVRGYSNTSLFFDKDKLDPYHARRRGTPTVQDNGVGFRIVRDN